MPLPRSSRRRVHPAHLVHSETARVGRRLCHRHAVPFRHIDQLFLQPGLQEPHALRFAEMARIDHDLFQLIALLQFEQRIGIADIRLADVQGEDPTAGRRAARRPDAES